jgi:peroxiredoxin
MENRIDIYIPVYRGHWCPFCCAYLKDLQSIAGSIEAAHGIAVTITSEGPDFLPTMRSQTGFRGEMIADPENTIATKMKASRDLSIAISEKKGYSHGMAQPAVIVLKKDGTVLYQWAIMPGLVREGFHRCGHIHYQANLMCR